ncbi:hypothetical protein ACPCHT_18935 [Nucisporomicrobium flavum]|jgi:hypothetical protein|uniref:hypothetical protein n=1 Tax=Nucisporomicrobium flavum TaxID=2785915 RepID=UPI0018F59FF5|nr:hypothetical protein [Nucisporomicrobium flavum]
MGDFDAVLERLCTDPAFQACLARDPDSALAGYRLAPDEVALLRQQVAGDAGAQAATVEQRVTKSSTFGIFGSLGGLADAPVGSPADGAAGIGPAYGARQGFGDAHAARGAGAGLGSAASRLGDAPRTGFGDAHLPAPEGYHNRVDADGDGTLDRATYRGHRGGGAEIVVDLDRDGRADFVGVDKDLDNRVDYADYDKDHDGVFEKRMYDDDGDGWLDRSVRR